MNSSRTIIKLKSERMCRAGNRSFTCYIMFSLMQRLFLELMSYPRKVVFLLAGRPTELPTDDIRVTLLLDSN